MTAQNDAYVAGDVEIDGALYVDGFIYGNGSKLTGLSSGASGLTWNDVTGTSASMAVQNGYIADNASLVTLTLPATAAVGQMVAVAGGVSGSGGWTIAENSGQTIRFGSVNVTTTSGTLSSTGQYDSVQLLCVKADTDFVVVASVGNMTWN
jgi:hypothetical protein